MKTMYQFLEQAETKLIKSIESDQDKIVDLEIRRKCYDNKIKVVLDRISVNTDNLEVVREGLLK